MRSKNGFRGGTTCEPFVRNAAQNVNRRAEKASSGAPGIEAELASEAARTNLRRNQTSGLEFVLQTVPWRPGDLS